MDEAPDRGYLSHVIVEFDVNTKFQMFFADPLRISQELQLDCERGRPYFAEPNLVILPHVTPANIRAAVFSLASEGFFEDLKPIKSELEQR